MAYCMHILAQYWLLLRMEKIDVHRSSDGTVLSMNQYRSVVTLKIVLDQWFSTSSLKGTESRTTILLESRTKKILMQFK